MDKYLALHTCGDGSYVVVGKNGEHYSRCVPDCAMRQSSLWLGVVDELLGEANMTLADCDFFSAVVGAGSFTGIRIGISAVKGFALAHGKKTLPITTFELAAYNGLDGVNEEKRLCLVDAMHGAYYACGYQNGKQVLAPAYLTEAEVLALRDEGYVLCATSPLPLTVPVRYTSTVDGLIAAVERRASENAFAPLSALYVRKSSAELNLCK